MNNDDDVGGGGLILAGSKVFDTQMGVPIFFVKKCYPITNSFNIQSFMLVNLFNTVLAFDIY